MKTTSILFSLALAFKAIYSKAIDNNDKITLEQLNVPEEDNSFKLVKSEDFIYKFHCPEENDCDQIQDSLNFALDKLSNALEFYQPVVFEVFVDDLTKKYGLGLTLAGVTDPNYVSLKTSKNSTPYLYPQSLVKQLKLNKQPKYKKNDFILLINNCNSLEEGKNNELRSLLIHEMLHGLGFMTLASLVQLTDNDDFTIDTPNKPLIFNETDKYAILPKIVPIYDEKILDITNEEEYMDQVINTELSKFLPFTVFDKNLVSLKSGEKVFGKLKSLHKEADKKCLSKDGSPALLKELTDKKLSDCFESLSSETRETITRIIKENFFEFQTLGILTKDGDTVPLQTFHGVYLPGSSVSHPVNPLFDEHVKVNVENSTDYLNDLYNELLSRYNKEEMLEYYDDNYVLYFADKDDLTVEEMLELLPNNKKHPLIGNNIIKVLKTLGWTEKGKRRSSKTYYLDESIDIPESNNFEYLFMKSYEFSNQEISSTEIETETISAYSMEEEPTFLVEEEPTFPAEEVETSVSVDEEEEEPTFPAEEVETSIPDEEESSFPDEELLIDYFSDELATLPIPYEFDEYDIPLEIGEIETVLPIYDDDDDEFVIIENPFKYFIKKLKDLFESLLH